MPAVASSSSRYKHYVIDSVRGNILDGPFRYRWIAEFYAWWMRHIG